MEMTLAATAGARLPTLLVLAAALADLPLKHA
jgi:hypothetical protein